MDIQIENSRVHNLKGISLKIPRNKLVVITGVSGSGKSSLVYDTVYAAAQREYFESLSSYARRSLPKFPKPDVDLVLGLSPCILIDQKPLGHNIRSTVGTVTEVYTFLRLLYSRLGEPILSAGDFSFNNPSGACPTCRGLGVRFVPDLDRLLDWEKSLEQGAIRHRTWKVESRYWNIIHATNLFDMSKPVGAFDKEELDVLLYAEPQVFTNNQPGYVQNFSFEGVVRRLIKRQNDERGLDSNDYDRQFFMEGACHECEGSRLSERARSVKVKGRSIVEPINMEIRDLLVYIDTIEGEIAEAIKPYIQRVLRHLIDSGVGYLTLSRAVNTLSGGEAQRVKLARQLGSTLTEVIYILDEPTIGLHPKDIDQLVELLIELTQMPSSVLVVEHDRCVIENADHIIELGPEAGVFGGTIVAEGIPSEIAKKNTQTGRMLSHTPADSSLRQRRTQSDFVVVKDACLHNLNNLTVKIPRNLFVCLTGVSGSGKSSLIQVLLRQHPEFVLVDQGPIGKSSRSTPLTYVKAFGAIRRILAEHTGQNPSLFTFNGKGACETCGGIGYISVDMHFLGDVEKECPECEGKRYKESVLQYRYKGKNVADILDMTIMEALGFFDHLDVRRKLKMLDDVGLGYLQLGQSLDTFSGGELQRTKLASYLSKKGNAFALDEPTRGLHHSDVKRLVQVIDQLVSMGNSVIVIEHNLDVIINADWVIDLGPGGGKEGGYVVAEGPPLEIAKCEASFTGQYLARVLGMA